MYETISIILNALLSGGLVVTLVTIKSTRAKAKANAKAVEIDNARKLLDNFDTFIVQPLKTEVNELRDTIQSLQKAIRQIQSCPNADSCPVSDMLDGMSKPPAMPKQKPLPSPAEPDSF